MDEVLYCRCLDSILSIVNTFLDKDGVETIYKISGIFGDIIITLMEHAERQLLSVTEKDQRKLTGSEKKKLVSHYFQRFLKEVTEGQYPSIINDLDISQALRLAETLIDKLVAATKNLIQVNVKAVKKHKLW